MDYAEVYTGLQTGAIDAQDNPLPNNKLMKFHEVTDQIVLTGHNVGFGLLLINAEIFDALTPEQQKTMQEAASLCMEQRGIRQAGGRAHRVLQGRGLDVYKPDIEAFRDLLEQEISQIAAFERLAGGMLERINKL